MHTFVRDVREKTASEITKKTEKKKTRPKLRGGAEKGKRKKNKQGKETPYELALYKTKIGDSRKKGRKKKYNPLLERVREGANKL